VSLNRLVFAGSAGVLAVAAGIGYARAQHSADAAVNHRVADTAVKQPAAVTADAWAKVWSAGFRGPAGSGADPAQWVYQTGTGTFGDGSVETMSRSPRNVHLNGDGELDITALRQGIWPEHGEIDIAEDVNAVSGHSGAFHCGNLVQRNADGTLGPCHEHTGLSSHLVPCGQCQAGFHTDSVIVDLRDPSDGQIRWYLDGREFFSVRETEVGAAVWDEAVDHGFWIILDLAIGGSYPDQACHCLTPNATTSSGGTMRVRDVAVYQRG